MADTHKIRTATMCFRVTPKEKEALEARFKICGIPKGDYIRESLLNQKINITAGKFHSDRLAVEIKKLREVLETCEEDETVEDTIKACNELLRQLLKVSKGDTVYDGTENDKYE